MKPQPAAQGCSPFPELFLLAMHFISVSVQGILQAPECTAAQHVACAGLDDEPEGEWYCATHRNKPSVKRRRSASVRSSAEPSGEHPE